MDKDSTLNMSLLGLQEELQNPKNSANNPFFHSKYAPLDEILKMVRPLLTKHKLIMWQDVGGDGENISIVTVLAHAESGEMITTPALQLKLGNPADPQKAGSVITYGRRYQLTAMLGIFGEDDDDGNLATHGATNPNRKPGERVKRDPGKRFERKPTPVTTINGIPV